MLITILELGLIFGLVLISTWLTSSLLKYDDLGIEASFCFGGALTACLITFGIHPWATLFIALLAGIVVGLITGFLHNTLKLPSIMSGVIIVAGFFSINLAIGTANISIIHLPNFLSCWPNIPGLGRTILPLVAIITALVVSLRWFLTTEIGLLVRAVGTNPTLLERLGKNTARLKLLVFIISSSTTALAGSLFVQYTGFFSIWSGVGTIITALTGLMLAQLLSKNLGIWLIVGAIIHQALVAVALHMNIAPEWNKLITAVLLILLIIIQRRSNA